MRYFVWPDRDCNIYMVGIEADKVYNIIKGKRGCELTFTTNDIYGNTKLWQEISEEKVKQLKLEEL